MRCSLLALFPACLLAMPALAAGEGSRDAETAERLFRQGHELLKQGRLQESCKSFAASQRAEPASGTLLALAYCEERSGRLASAWQSYREAGEMAVAEHHPDRQAAASERAAALLPRLSTLTLSISPSVATTARMQVRQDGHTLDPGLLGTPIPIDGGSHVIEASAAGRKPWSLKVTIRDEGDHQTVTIAELNGDDTVPAAAVPAVTSKPSSAPAPPKHDDAGRSSATLRHVSLGLAIGGVVSLGVGTALALVASSKNNASYANGHCDDSGCDDTGMELRSDALVAANWATASFILGGALAASSLTLFIMANSTPSQSNPASHGMLPFRSPRIGISGTF